MSKKSETSAVVLECGMGGGPGAGPGVVVVDASGITIRENLTQIARPYRTARLEFEDLESVVGGAATVYLRTRGGGIRAVGLKDPEVGQCFADLAAAGIAAHDPDPDPHAVLSSFASAPASVERALEEEHRQERKERPEHLKREEEERRRRAEESRQRDRETLERNRAACGLPPLSAEQVERWGLLGTEQSKGGAEGANAEDSQATPW